MRPPLAEGVIVQCGGLASKEVLAGIHASQTCSSDFFFCSGPTGWDDIWSITWNPSLAETTCFHTPAEQNGIIPHHTAWIIPLLPGGRAGRPIQPDCQKQRSES
ncbi:Hypp2501 [Branchiostoma lanceolatum]|uniref:Hypp2501 protein n=1 Tax=Branchiostoma lanceolatum TaxID=7740 RepID=A0A8J9ZTW4_BRALA|nr:Hypp2501 [Branchiostoma lanceolatum]